MNRAFYITKEDQRCKSGQNIWPGNGQKAYESGLFGQEMKIFKEARSNVKLNQQIPKLNPNIVNYIACAPFDNMTFDPDLLIILTNSTSQAEIILRAMTYTTGEVWTSRTTCVMGCSWLLAYPHNTGHVNYIPTGFGTGIIAKKLFPEGKQLLSIPYNWIPVITQSLGEMPWRIPAWDVEDVIQYVGEIDARLGSFPV